MTEMIPISEIDSLIAEYREHGYSAYKFSAGEIIEVLEYLKQKAISAIPISKIDAKIKEVEESDSFEYHEWEVAKMLEDLKE